LTAVFAAVFASAVFFGAALDFEPLVLTFFEAVAAAFFEAAACFFVAIVETPASSIAAAWCGCNADAMMWMR
jgi:hypothetical protein